MPGESSGIPPADEVTGSLFLPLARVKKTIAQDEDIGLVSAQSNFLITKATEMFIRHLADRAFTSGKSATKNKKSLLYRDICSPFPITQPNVLSLTHIAHIVQIVDNLEFISDLVPPTTTWKEHKAKKARQGKPLSKNETLPAGQTTLDGKRPASATPNDLSILSNDSPSSQPVNGARPSSSKGLIFQHYEPNGTSKGDNQSDVEMT
ncbi:hypothetical protein MMC10_002303 [Thelotrema lepadinum]|nr:hypothetical protein [Thelotrema lepadinum]